MPELPDLTVYVERLSELAVGHRLEAVEVTGPSLLRTFEPPVSACAGATLAGVSRLGKRIVLGLDIDVFLVVHLMVAGRLQWRSRGNVPAKKSNLAALHFDNGILMLTETGTRKRASLHVARGAEGLAVHDRGGLEPLECNVESFKERLLAENHTLKRALTDPRLIAGIGNAYSDEILHAAKLSPVALTGKLSDEEVERLYSLMRETLAEWTVRLREEAGDEMPRKVTAFRDGMAVHGRYRLPCPECGTPVQRIVYAGNETNYCAACQTGGKLLADRALSRVLKSDWPKSIEELEAFKDQQRNRLSGG